MVGAAAAPARSIDDTIHLSIRSLHGKTVRIMKFNRRYPPDWIAVTLRNDGEEKVILPLPGDGSEWGSRTPVIGWEIRDPGGALLSREPVGICGNLNAIRREEVFELLPGQERTFNRGLPDWYPYKKGHRYRVTFKYENRPEIGRPDGIILGRDDAEAIRLLGLSAPCKLVSNTIEVKIK